MQKLKIECKFGCKKIQKTYCRRTILHSLYQYIALNLFTILLIILTILAGCTKAGSLGCSK